jgi:DNA-binding transcriptional LysR family regulator
MRVLATPGYSENPDVARVVPAFRWLTWVPAWDRLQPFSLLPPIGLGSCKSATGEAHAQWRRAQSKMLRASGHSALWLVYPKSNVLTAKVRVFMDFLLEHVGQHPVWAGPA